MLHEKWGENLLTTIWDNEDNVCGINYNGTEYYFLKNLQGDVIAITNGNGEVVARYSYDAWGVPTIVSDTSGANIAQINPFRYRGYYYDSETQLYYLQSRYYNPVVGRFVNVDEAAIVKYVSNISDFNLYGYCKNSPANYVDHSGFSAIIIGGLVLSAGTLLALLLVSVFTIAYLFDKNFRDSINTLVSMIYEGSVNIIGYLTNVISEALEDARRGRRYSTNEVHHIVAHKDIRAQGAVDLLVENHCDVEAWYNKVSIKKELHKHLHTNAYFAAVELFLVATSAHVTPSGKRRSSIIAALLFIATILRLTSDII